MPELGSYGSVGVPTGNRRHYPEKTTGAINTVGHYSHVMGTGFYPGGVHEARDQGQQPKLRTTVQIDFRGLTRGMNADKMSAMKTFTVRELDREPASVLDACDREGAVRIRRRNGRTYTMRPDTGPDRIMAVPDIRARLTQIFPKPLTPEQTRRADKLLAGE